MSLLTKSTLAASKALRSSRVVATPQWHRCMSLISLEGEEIEKFRMTNSKSVLMFTATWCPPCKVIKPVYKELAKEETDVAMGTVDIDEEQDAAMEFQISAVPTFVFLTERLPSTKWQVPILRN